MAQPRNITSLREPAGCYSFRRASDYTADQTPDISNHRSYSDLANSHAVQHYTGPSVQSSEARSNSWRMTNDREVKRKRRLAGYKVFALEGKLKSSVRKSFQWLKGKYADAIYGWN